MRNGKRGGYTLDFKQEAIRLVAPGQSIAEAARSLGVVESMSFSESIGHGESSGSQASLIEPNGIVPRPGRQELRQ